MNFMMIGAAGHPPLQDLGVIRYKILRLLLLYYYKYHPRHPPDEHIIYDALF